MWQDDSPWGASADDGLATSARPPSPLPTLASFNSTTTSLPTTNSWGGDDMGGWGSSHDEHVPGFASTSATTLDSPPASRDDDGVKRSSPPMWIPPSDIPSHDNTISALPEAIQPIARTPSPPGFDAPASTTTSFRADNNDHDLEHAQPEEDEPVEETEERGWGEHGASPELPPIANLSLDPVEPIVERDKGWGDEGDEAWVPPEIPEAMPSFGDAFGKPKPRKASVDEGWGGGANFDDSPSYMNGGDADGRRSSEVGDETREEGHVERHQERSPSPAPIKIQAATVTSSGQELQFDEHGNTILPPHLQAEYEAHLKAEAEFEERKKAAAIARGQAVKEESAESKPAITKSSWWRSKAETTASTVKSQAETTANTVKTAIAAQMEPSAPARVASPTTPDGQAPSRLGRLFGKLRRSQTESNEGSTATETTIARGVPHTKAAAIREYTDDTIDDSLPPEWMPKNLDAIESSRARGNNTTFPRGDQLDELFGESPRKSGRVPTAPPEDDFGGLLGAFSQAPKKHSASRRGPPKAHDPFDPFADDADEVLAPPSFVPRIASPALSSPSSFSMASPGPGPNTSIRSSFVSPPPSSSARISSFGSSALGPPPSSSQAGAVDDSFDEFFDSMASSTSKPKISTSTYEDFNLAMPKPRTAAPSKSFVVPPPSIMPRMNLSRGPSLAASPPPRAATASPKIVNPLAPPPPPSQPLASRHLINDLVSRPASATGMTSNSGFGSIQRVSSPISSLAPPTSFAPAPAIAPPPGMSTMPLAPSPVGSIRRSPASLSPNPPSQPSKSGSGPLGLEDLSFFES